MKLSIGDAGDALRDGKVVGVPTQTVYGLAADAMNARAIGRVFSIKNRPLNHPCPVLVSSTGALDACVMGRPTKGVYALMDAFWPGGLTIVMRARPALPEGVISGGTVALRQDGDEVLAELFVRSGIKLLTGTSANISGNDPLLAGSDVSNTFDSYQHYAGHVGVRIEEGSVPSTIVDMSTDVPHILREGAVERSSVDDVLASCGLRLS
jgi:tRNA threonylcarbamoyl adenosine modification protein (Sua5/YciO/YrdC/YwlC family)